MSDPNIATVLAYFDACNTGDLDAFRQTLHDNVVHYFLPEAHKPIRGADHLAKYWSKFRLIYDPVWRIDHAIGSGEEVVSEWSCAYTLPASGRRMLFRGTEWYVLSVSRIAEVRAYYHYDESRDSELTGFPYIQRSYLQKTVAG
jgi:ketosteroid isomerase-like protein